MDCVVAMSDENGKLVVVRAFLPPDLRNSFKSLCVREGITMNDVIVDFIEEYVKEREPEIPRPKKTPDTAKRQG